MTNARFIKTLTAGLALALAIYPQVQADDTGSCGTNCTYVYDSNTQTLTFSGTGTITGFYKASDFGPVKTLIVGEGITRLQGNQILFRYFGDVENSKLVLPSTLTALTTNTISDTKFKTIEMSTQNMTEISWPSIRNTGLNNLVLTPGGNVAFPSSIDISGTFNVQCKGAIEDCQKVLVNIPNKVLNLDHYKEYDGNNNLILEYTDTGYIRYDEEGNIIAKYDLSNNLQSSYTYNSDGSTSVYDASGKLTGLKNAKSISPTQAAALVKKGNNNTVTLTVK